MKRAKVVSVFAGIAAMSAGLLIEVKRIDENLLGKKRNTKRMLLVRVSLYSILCVCQHVELLVYTVRGIIFVGFNDWR